MGRHNPSKGFTIVELLIVIVVIAILAAITIIAYNGVRRQAIESSMKSDLRNASTQAASTQATSGAFPASAAAFNNGQGIAVSGGNVLSYNLTPYGFCLVATNTGTTTSFRIKSGAGVVNGSCVAVSSTFAGGTYGFQEGAAADARFALPVDVALAPNGNYYVADRDNHRIRMITPDGTVSTFAGSGAATNTNGTGVAASFQNPAAITVDTQGNFYVLSASACLRKITPAALVSTLNACGYGFNDGAVAGAQFRNPDGLAVDSAGNVYIADRTNHRIRLLTVATNMVSTIAGSGSPGATNNTGILAQFNYPSDIVVDGSGVIYVADSLNHRIRKIMPGGAVSDLAGSSAGYADGTGAAAQFSYPDSIAIDMHGNLYVTEQDNSHRIRKITPAGVVTTLAGNGTAGSAQGEGSAAQLNYPGGITIDPKGRLMFTESDRVRILEL